MSESEKYRIYEDITSSYVIGFHGCNKSVAEKLLKSNTPAFEPSKNAYDWLGSGMYFWENDIIRAEEFISEKQKREPGLIKNPVVVGAVIDLGHSLNLVERRYIGLVQEAHEDYKKFTRKKNMAMPSNGSGFKNDGDLVLRNLDRAVIEFLHESVAKNHLKPFDTVRCIFPEGEELYKGAGFRKKTHIQIAVRNPEMIKGYFRPIVHHRENRPLSNFNAV